MALLKLQGYENDVTISYSHIDNQNVDEEWVSNFHVMLWERIITFDSRIKIWRDEKITGNEFFDLTLEEIFKSSAILISCVSRNYIRSIYCQKELNFFYTQIQEKSDPYGLLINNKSRLFNILISDLARDKWPAPLGGSEGYCFHDDHGYPLDIEDPKFKSNIKISAKDIWELLSWMHMGKPRKEIFFADSPPDIESSREVLEDELRIKFRLRPDEPLPILEKMHRERVSSLIKQACGSIHLFGRNGTDKKSINKFLDSSKECYICQAEEALKSTTPQLIWFPKLSGESESYNQYERDFINILSAAQSGGESDSFNVNKELAIIEGSPANICHQVSNWVERLLNQEPDNQFWLVDAKAEESFDKFSITTTIENLSITVLNYQRSDDLANALRKSCRYIIIIKSSPATSLSRLEEALKLISQLERGYKVGVFLPLLGKALNDVQKDTLRKYQKDDVVVYDQNADGFDGINSIDQFIEKLK